MPVRLRQVRLRRTRPTTTDYRRPGPRSGPGEKDSMLTFVLSMLLAVTPLVDAVKSGDSAAAVALLAKGADVNVAEPDGTTALHWAVHRGDVDLVHRLVRA